MTPSASRSGTSVSATNSKQAIAYKLIRSRIEGGNYAPGQRLVIDQLAVELGMSQVPIREAIRRLEAEYLIKYSLNTGPMVAPFDAENWVQMVETIAVLEGYATARAAPAVTAADIKLLKACNQSIREALDDSNLAAISKANRQFHSIILARCPNTTIMEQLTQTQARLDSLSRALFARDQAVLMQLLGPKAAQTAVTDHEELIAALQAKRAASVIEKLTREHVLVHLRNARKFITGGHGVADSSQL